MSHNVIDKIITLSSDCDAAIDIALKAGQDCEALRVTKSIAKKAIESFEGGHVIEFHNHLTGLLKYTFEEGILKK